ncbi:MAG: hypothetical protein JWL86_1751 [Rhizobium sp.]|nr:hypothetical protein [Rhizobium sp.]
MAIAGFRIATSSIYDALTIFARMIAIYGSGGRRTSNIQMNFASGTSL